MSRINVNSIASKSGLGAVDFPHGITVTGVVTATTLNANVSGAVTATSFHGDGAGLTNVSPSSVNASNLDSGTVPDARFPASLPAVDGSALTNVNAVGLTGAPSLTVTNLNATGNVSIAGTLTYEDVTNIDSVGILTARQGIIVVGGGITAVGVVTATKFIGDGSELSGVVSGIEVKSDGTSVGTSLTAINFSGATITTGSAGITTVTIAGWEVRDTWLYGGG